MRLSTRIPRCYFIRCVNWKVKKPHAAGQSPAVASTGDICVDVDRSDQLAVETMLPPRVGGLALAFENQSLADYAESVIEGCENSSCSSCEQVEPEQDNSSSGPVLRAENNTGGCLQNERSWLCSN